MGGTGEHEFDGEAEETASFVGDHIEVVRFAGAAEVVAPEELHPLAAVEVEKFLYEHHQHESPISE